MGKARNRAERTGSMDVVIGTTKLVPDGSGDLEIKDASNNRKKIIASEIKLGTGNDVVIIKRNTSTGQAQFQSSTDGGGSTTEQSVGGAGIVTNASDLPITGNQAGDLKLVTSTNNLMIHNGSGWYKIATITNASPTISSAGNANYTFATDGTPVSIEIVASDPEGVSLQYKYQVTTGSLGSTAAVTNSATSGGTYSALAANTYSNNRFFKVTPSTTEAHAGTFAITFSVTDGVNTANSTVSSFTLGFSVSGSVVFDGTGDYIEFPNQYNLGQAGADWTVEFWAWFTDFGQSLGNSNANCILIGKNNNGIAIEGYNWNGIVPGTGKIRVVRNNTGSIVLTSDTLIVPKTWYHIAVTNTGSSNTQKLYINGVQDSATGSYASAFTFSDTKTIVGGAWWSSQLKLPFRGYLSNVRTVASSVYSPSAQSAGSTVFDGTGDYLLTAEDSELVLGSGDFTIEHWLYMSGTGTGQIIEYRKQGAGYSTGNIATYVSSGNSLGVFRDAANLCTTGAALSQNKWYHVAVVKHNGTMTLYIDGKLSSDFGAGGTATYSDTNTYDSNQITIGIHGNDRSTYPFQGKISNVRITIGTALYTDRFTRPQRPFTKVTNTQLLTCQNSSGSITDASDNNVTITAGGDAAGNTAHPFETAGNDYNTGSAFTLPTAGLSAISNTKLLTAKEPEPLGTAGLNFGSSNSTITTLASHSGFDFGTNDFTIEFFYKWSTNSGYQTVLDHAYNAADGVAIQSNTGTYKWGWFGSSLSLAYESSDATAGLWYHYALVRNGNNCRIYRDGVVTREFTHTGTIGGVDPTTFGGVSSQNDHYDFGKISNFRVVKGTALYTSAGFTIPTAPLTAISGTSLLLFQENSGSTLDDGSTNNVTITKGSGHTILTGDGPFHKFTVPTDPLGVISNTKLLTCNDSNVINDGSTLNHSTKINGNTIATKFNPF